MGNPLHQSGIVNSVDVRIVIDAVPGIGVFGELGSLERYGRPAESRLLETLARRRRSRARSA